MSTALHGHCSPADTSRQKLYTGKDQLDPRDLQLKVKVKPPSTLVGSKDHHGDVMTFGRQDAVTSREALVDFPHVVTAMDVYKVNITHYCTLPFLFKRSTRLELLQKITFGNCVC